MANNRQWNKNIYRKLNNLKKMDQKQLVSKIQKNTEMYSEAIRNAVPYLYGGLKTSVYSDIRLTQTGVVGVIGIDNTKHINLDPTKKVSTDNFTNKELAGWLLNKPNKSQGKMKYVKSLLNDYITDTRDDIADYWDSKIKRR